MKDTLSQLPGVAEVDVDFDAKVAHCKMESKDTKLDTDAAIAALAKEKFKASVVE